MSEVFTLDVSVRDRGILSSEVWRCYPVRPSRCGEYGQRRYRYTDTDFYYRLQWCPWAIVELVWFGLSAKSSSSRSSSAAPGVVLVVSYAFVSRIAGTSDGGLQGFL